MLKEIVGGTRGHQNGVDGTFQDATFEIIRKFSKNNLFEFSFLLAILGGFKNIWRQEKNGKILGNGKQIKRRSTRGGQGKEKLLHRQQV